MHQSSYEKMNDFREIFLKNREKDPLLILDLGSMDVNGSYRKIFEIPGWTYKGIDMEEGKNVDIVLSNPYAWSEIRSNSIDVLVSGQAFEHIEYFWITMLEIFRILKPDGLCCIIAPSAGFEHRYPVDCWRFYPDGMRALAGFARMTVLETSTQWKPNQKYLVDDSNKWQDTRMVCRKDRLPAYYTFRRYLRNRLLHRILTLRL